MGAGSAGCVCCPSSVLACVSIHIPAAAARFSPACSPWPRPSCPVAPVSFSFTSSLLRRRSFPRFCLFPFRGLRGCSRAAAAERPDGRPNPGRRQRHRRQPCPPGFACQGNSARLHSCLAGSRASSRQLTGHLLSGVSSVSARAVRAVVVAGPGGAAAGGAAVVLCSSGSRCDEDGNDLQGFLTSSGVCLLHLGPVCAGASDSAALCAVPSPLGRRPPRPHSAAAATGPAAALASSQAPPGSALRRPPHSRSPRAGPASPERRPRTRSCLFVLSPWPGAVTRVQRDLPGTRAPSRTEFL